MRRAECNAQPDDGPQGGDRRHLSRLIPPGISDGGRRVEVTGTARLHLGFLDLNFALGRRFGSVGLSLDTPCTQLTLARAEATRIDGPEQTRAERHLTTLVRALSLSGGHVLRIERAIQAHAGLGSGTQLALAIAVALRALHGLPAAPVADAVLLGRGARSGIGIGLFQHGGLVLDGGKGAGAGPPPILARLRVPEAWRVLLLVERTHQGLSGREEVEAFAALPPMAATAAGELCRLTVMQMLPAAAEGDLPAFGAAVTRMQEIVGDYFAPAQGSRVTSPRVASALARLAALGATGLGQSSWGPTGFAFLDGEQAAVHAAATLAADAAGAGLDIMICRGLNRGAIVTLA